MRRLAVAVAVVAVAVIVAPAVAYSETIWATCTSGGQAQTCNSMAWYPAAVTVVWHASPPPNAVTGCGLEINYRYSSDQITTVACSATWPGPGSGTTTISEPYTLHVETSSPTATVAPSRPPDSGGWYNHPVTGTPSATAFSGIASCTPTTYAGPDSAAATVWATCVDNAGKRVTVASAPFAYDVTPPTLSATARSADKRVALSWQTGGDIAPIASVSVARSPGPRRAAADTLYRGAASRYVDTHVRNRVRYTYTITAIDQAGHATVKTVVATPGPRLLSPIDAAHLAGPPMLSWTPVRGATYYNVQLFRDGKVLSMWPGHASLQLRRRWRFDGHRHRLKPGKYRWFVWPGYGKRSAGRYGHAIGSGTFVVVR